MKLIYNKEELEGCTSDVLYERAFDGTPFVLKGLRVSNPSNNTWPTSIVAIYFEENLLGGYHRTYGAFGADTFYPFKWEDVWYALYSANYTCTRVMRFSAGGFEDWCGEEASGHGFCPTAYYLPQCFITTYDNDTYHQFENGRDYRQGYQAFLDDAKDEDARVEYPGFGFLCGCVWGDDNDWKLRYVDYSNVTNRVLKIDERFGYHPLPDMPLSACVDLSAWETSHPLIITAQRTFTVSREPETIS